MCRHEPGGIEDWLGSDPYTRLMITRHADVHPRFWMRGRPTYWVLVLMLLAGLVSCSGAPDRAAEAADMATAIRELPGVEAVTDRYAHGVVEGDGLYLQVDVMAGATSEDVLGVTRTVLDRFGSGGFDLHTVSLIIRRGDDDMAIFGDSSKYALPETFVVNWSAMVRSIPGVFLWHIDLGSRINPESGAELVAVSATVDSGFSALFAAVADGYPQLSNTQWTVNSRNSRLDSYGPSYPPATVAAVLDVLAADDGEWGMTYTPDAAVPLTSRVWVSDVAKRDVMARRQLPMLAALGLPVNYSLRASGVDDLEILVGGCLAGGDAVQQELNKLYGHC